MVNIITFQFRLKTGPRSFSTNHSPPIRLFSDQCKESTLPVSYMCATHMTLEDSLLRLRFNLCKLMSVYLLYGCCV